MSDLTGFLLARIAEDEADATVGWRWKALPLVEYDRLQLHLLRECEAKRRIVTLHTGAHDCPIFRTDGSTDYEFFKSYMPCPTLNILTTPYYDHPDCLPGWKP